jgi:hypothetical protein
MKRTTRRLVIALCIIVGVIIVLSVAIRLILTRDVLMELVVPRIERVVGAEISIGDIGVRFPFGFGVDIKELSFEKKMPQGEILSFGSETLVARASLWSLVKRKPVIKRVDIMGGTIGMTGGQQAVEASVEGLRANFSMNPAAAGYRIAAEISASSVKVAARETPALTFGDVRFEGEMTMDAAFDSIHIVESKADWGTFASFDISGDLWDLKAARSVSLEVAARGIDLPALVERVLALGVLPATAGPEGKAVLPVALRTGSLDLEAVAKGSMARPSALSVSGTVHLKGLEVEHPAVTGPVTVQGAINFSESHLGSNAISVAYRSSSADIGFDVTIAERKRPERIEVTCNAALRLEDFVPPPQHGAPAMNGFVDLRLKVQGAPADFTSLVPAAGTEISPERIGAAWKRVLVEGTAAFKGISVATPESPVRVSALEGRAALEGGSAKEVEAAFRLNGSPYRCEATLENLMPAAVELLSKAKGADPASFSDLGPLLSGMKNVPRFSVTMEGRSLDLRPFEKRSEAKSGKEGASVPGRPDKAAPASPLMLLALKNTVFEAKIDTILASKALFTAVKAKGSITDGVLRADPIVLGYAGGTGRAKFEADLRKPGRVQNRLDLSFENVQANKALGAIHPLGGLLEGTFTVKSDASFVSGPGLNPLITLSGKGLALSKTGTVDVSRFLAPITQSGLIDLSHLQRFDFRDWQGDFIIRDGRFMTENWTIRSSKGDWAIRGSFGFDGTLDYRAHLVVPPSVQQQMKDLSKYRDLVDLFRDTGGNLVLDLNVGGTGMNPTISVDMSTAKNKATEKAMDSILQKAKDLFKK